MKNQMHGESRKTDGFVDVDNRVSVLFLFQSKSNLHFHINRTKLLSFSTYFNIIMQPFKFPRLLKV